MLQMEPFPLSFEVVSKAIRAKPVFLSYLAPLWRFGVYGRFATI